MLSKHFQRITVSMSQFTAMKTSMVFLSFLAFVLGSLKLAATDLQPNLEATGVHTWQRWEHVLSSSRTNANPYAEVTLRVSYSGPGNSHFQTYGFWDGGQTFRIRFAFPSPGVWQWKTQCSDSSNTGLHDQKGTVHVSKYNGTNWLYQHGFLKVSDNRRFLMLNDSTPFLWIGDTAWAAPMKASDEEWETYTADRATKHFTMIQIAPAPEWAGDRDRLGQEPFMDKSCAEWNPAYWQSFERKVQRANERGLHVMMVGLMEPVYRYPEPARACLFARNIIARLSGNFVSFSPSFDSKYLPLADEVGRAAREASAMHLVTQHPGTPWNQPIPTFSTNYYDKPYLDFVGVQSGHNGGHVDWSAHHAIEWNLHLYHHEPHKPVINLEAMYDGHGQKGWRAMDARSMAWRTWLSGAVGYTYGAGETQPNVPAGDGGIWKWVTDQNKPDYWQKALQWDSAFQMQYLHDFLATLEWWRLEPAHQLILNQPADVTRRMVLAKTASGDFAVAYLPDNETAELDVSGFPSPMIARWYDPVQGRFNSESEKIQNEGKHPFKTPSKSDWVLLLQRSHVKQKP
jgi:hypothetical protein